MDQSEGHELVTFHRLAKAASDLPLMPVSITLSRFTVLMIWDYRQEARSGGDEVQQANEASIGVAGLSAP